MSNRNNDLFEKEEKLKQKLDQFTVEIPDFPIKKSRITRIANWMFSSSSIPFPEYGYQTISLRIILLMPIVLVSISILPLLFVL